MILAHQGSDIEYENFYTLRPHAEIISRYLEDSIEFLPDICGPTAQSAIKELKEGQVLLLDNVRFMAEEQTLFELSLKLTQKQQAKTIIVRTLAPLADYYVCDAFAAAHRNQPTLCGFEQVLPSVMGRLFEKEYNIISSIIEMPERPCVFILGGAKIADAFLMLRSVLEKGVADKVLTGGLVGHVLLEAKGIKIGQKSLDYIYNKGFKEYIDNAILLLEQYRDKIVLPADLAYIKEGKREEVDVNQLPDQYMLTDIGSKTADFYSEVIKNAKTVL